LPHRHRAPPHARAGLLRGRAGHGVVGPGQPSEADESVVSPHVRDLPAAPAVPVPDARRPFAHVGHGPHARAGLAAAGSGHRGRPSVIRSADQPKGARPGEAGRRAPSGSRAVTRRRARMRTRASREPRRSCARAPTTSIVSARATTVAPPSTVSTPHAPHATSEDAPNHPASMGGANRRPPYG